MLGSLTRHLFLAIEVLRGGWHGQRLFCFQIQHHAVLLGPGAYQKTHLPADLLPPPGTSPTGEERAGERDGADAWLATAGWAGSEKLHLFLASPHLRTMLTCQAAAAAAAATVEVAAVAAAVSQKRRAPVSTWPAVSQGTSPSLCCSLTTTSSAEAGGRAEASTSQLSLFHGTGDMGRTYELRPQLGPALTLQNLRDLGKSEAPFVQSLGHHCQWGFHSASLYLLRQLVHP